MKKEDLKQTEKKKRIKEDISVSRKSILGWFLTFFMISGLMFSLGILVGRGTAPISFNINELEKDIKALKKTFSIDNNDSAANRLSDNPELEFYDALKEGKEDSRIIVKKITQSQVPIPKEEYVQKTVNSTSRDTEIKINITPPDSSEGPAEKIRRRRQTRKSRR